MIFALIYIPIIPALTFSKIRNLFQNFFQADMAIFSIHVSSKKLENQPPFTNPGCPSIIPRAMILSTDSRSTRNII